MKTKETYMQGFNSPKTLLLPAIALFGVLTIPFIFILITLSSPAQVFAIHDPEHCAELFGSSGQDYESCISQFEEEVEPTPQEGTPPDFGVECEGHDPSSGCCNGVRVSIGVDCEQNENPVLGYLAGVLNFLAGGVIVVVTGMLVVGGVQYITSGGVPQKLEAARKRITDALIALVLFIFLYAILQWLIPGGLFG